MSIHQFHARNDHHRSPMSWHMVLDCATTLEEVVSVARDFVASFTPYETEFLPPECRPRKIVDAKDVSDYAFELTRASCTGQGEGAAIADKFKAFFADAAARVASLSARGEDAGRETA
ncbi:MAG TPA: hypothetical protein VFJ62_19195 [Usitatibacter sp.]|nr:hypothetical protein [Usitatibacter sp.]